MSESSFYGRSTELETLHEELELVRSTGAGRMVALRGRRQVGKSRLVEHFAAGSGVPYGGVAGLKGTPVEVQMRRALDTLRSSTAPLPALGAMTAAVPADWYDLLGRLSVALGAGPAILVFDEFPWADEASPGLDGLLQSLWERDLRRRAVLLVLVGSDEAMMRQLFEHDRPLFGRLARTIVLQPFNPAETAAALGGRPAFDALDAQLITGGFPELVAHAARFPSADGLVADALARPHTVLADVAQINLAGELAERSNARLVLEAMGADEVGVVSFSRVAAMLGGGTTAQTAVTRALSNLVETKGIVALDLPAGRRGGRLTRYRIADSYLRFWFRFVEPHLRDIEVGRSDLALADFRLNWKTWRGKAIEPIAREGLLRLSPRLDPPFAGIESVAGWWDRKGTHEVDLVGTGHEGDVRAVGSVKWRESTPFGRRDLDELALARSYVPRAESARLVALAPRGVSAGVAADLVVDAEDLVGAWAG